MKNNLTIRDKKMIYLEDSPFVSDAFDDVFSIDDYLVACNSSKLLILNPEGQIIVSEEGTIMQIHSWGKCVSIQKGNMVGVYHYDGSLLIPFEFYRIFIVDSDNFIFEVQDTPQSGWRQYSLSNH